MSANNPTAKAVRNACENLLKFERNDRIEKSILPSEVKVIDRLLQRGLELEHAYKELYDKLSAHPHALKVFFEQLLSIAAFWNPEANQEARQGRVKLIKVNQRIEVVAAELAELLNERTELNNHSGFSCETIYHPIDLIHAAAIQNYSYGRRVKEQLEVITGQFDLKYWPSLSLMAQAVADDAAKAVPRPDDAVTGAGTEGVRAGLADSFKALFVALDESKARMHGFIPDAFKLTDQSVADLMVCALDLSPGQVNSDFVKGLRQRQREKSRERI